MITPLELERLRDDAVDGLAAYLDAWASVFKPGWPVPRDHIARHVMEQLEEWPESPWLRVATAALWEGWRRHHADDPLEAP